MKSCLFVLLFIFSQSIHAQNKTGTGGVLDVPPVTIDKAPDVVGGVWKKEELAVVTFASTLYYQEKECRSKKHESAYLERHDVMDIYLRLSMIQTIFKPDLQCSNVDEYILCLNSLEVKNHLKNMLETKGVEEYLKAKYKLTDKQSKAVLKFYEDLGKKCEDPSDCKM